MNQLFKLALPVIGRAGFLKYIFLGMLSGLWSFLFINLLTQVVNHIITGNYKAISTEYILIFLLVILLFVWTRRTLSLGVISLSQQLFWRMRKQILSSVINSDYEQLAGKKNEIYSTVVHDVNILTQASLSLIDFTTSAIIAVSCLVFLATISFTLFLITLGTALLGIAIYYFGSRVNNSNFQQARKLENKFLQSFNAILDGAKEIFMEPGKGQYIYEHRINKIADESYRNNTMAFAGFLNNQIVGQVFFYLLISSVLLVFSIILGIRAGDSVRFVFILLYLLGSIEMLMTLLPAMMRARVSMTHLLELRKTLGENTAAPVQAAAPVSRDEFEHIVIKNLEFQYEGAQLFGIGPVDLEIKKGQVLFIYGGNGSGKTTLIHTILGLHKLTAGEIRLNETLVTDTNYPVFKSAFAVVFSDFYLFDEIPGTAVIDTARWEQYLELFELKGKVALEGRQFSTTDLSTGQRKRLALIAALMENKPLLVLDEWAADQDPYFRQKFYTSIIPQLKKEGITVIAITHDDRYYHIADELYKMEYGRLNRENIQTFSNKVV